MDKTFQTLEFNKIIEKLENYAYTAFAKEQFQQMRPYLSEVTLHAKMKETTEARKILEQVGTPTLVSMKDIGAILNIVEKSGLLSAVELEYVAKTLRTIGRLKNFLNRAKSIQVSIAYFADELIDLEELREEIESCIIDGKVSDQASPLLKDIRRDILLLDEKIRNKAESILAATKSIRSEDFVSYRGGHVCLPIKKEYKNKIEGSVIDSSRTGGTVFIEPAAISILNEELSQLKIEESNEELRILYTLTASLSDVHDVFLKNKKIVEELDVIFAKGKLSLELNAIEPEINTQRYIKIVQGRHPLLNKETSVPLDFSIGNDVTGIIITGPNTGGKTVCIKTVGLLSFMAGCGLHVPCKEADICMNNIILCDIGDGQDLAQNLSTFSAHISHIIDILSKTTKESLVLLDELGSGTDPVEGMGIAIAILEELRKKSCLFVATTHYCEVKDYAEKTDGIINARMAFDRNSLQPLYLLEMKKAGQSQALYIAKKLGMPNDMIVRAYKESYKNNEIDPELLGNDTITMVTSPLPKIVKRPEYKEAAKIEDLFQIGDSVTILPDKKIGIVCKKANDKGEFLIQRNKEKFLVNYKRLKLKVPASMLYPEDYDFSILFDSVENRKKRHDMERKYCPGMEIEIEE